MVRRDEVHIRVTVVGLTPGDPASVTVSRTARRPNGKNRTFVQRVWDEAPGRQCIIRATMS